MYIIPVREMVSSSETLFINLGPVYKEGNPSTRVTLPSKRVEDSLGLQAKIHR